MHIVEFTNGQFAIRRWSPIGWQLLNKDANSRHWWLNNEEYIKYAVFPTEDSARERAKVYMSNARKYKVKRRIKI